MKLNYSKSLLVVAGLACVTVAGFQNCSSASAPAAADQSLSSSAAVSASPISLSPAAVSISAGSTQQFQITGGNGKYQLTSLNGCGSVDANYLFTAPSTAQTCTLMAVDGSGLAAYASVTVSGQSSSTTATSLPFAASFLPIVNGSTETAVIIPTGGSGHYTYSIVSGAGTLTLNAYVTTASGESAVVRVSDGTQTLDVPIAVASLGTPAASTPPPPATPVVGHWTMIPGLTKFPVSCPWHIRYDLTDLIGAACSDIGDQCVANRSNGTQGNGTNFYFQCM